MNWKTLLLLVVVFSTIAMLGAETLEETIQSLSGDAAKSYVSPIVSAFGTNMNGGWYHKAPKARLFRWDLEFGVVFTATFFKDDDDFFDVNGAFNFNKEQAEALTASLQPNMPSEAYNALVQEVMNQTFTVGIFGPTITGPMYDELNPTGTGINIAFPSQDISFTYNGFTQTETIPSNNIIIPVGGLLSDLPMLPLAVPQLSIGTIAGTQFSLRYLPTVETTEELGGTSYLGYGLQHNPAFWLPFKLPIDTSISFFTQKLELGDIIEASASTYGVNVSKTFGLKLASITPYAGYSLESSNMVFKYNYILDQSDFGEPIYSQIKFDIDGKNKSRMTAGLSLRLALININVDYNIADYPSFSTGMMLNFSW